MSYERSKPKYDIRNFLTEEEAQIVDKADEAKRVWLSLNKERSFVLNRAIQRAKYKRQP